jgi:D-amino peptidase
MMPRRLATALALTALAATTAAAQRPVRVFISVDMEGIAGVVSNEQLGPQGFEYGAFREFMTAEVNAAIAGAREAGATQFVIADAHGNGQNLLIDKLPPEVTVVRSWPRPLMMMQGVDSTIDAAIFIGYHSSTSNSEGVRAHTISSATLTGVALNGTQMTEGSINAAIAGHFGVPIVLVTGDDAAVSEVQRVVGAIEGAVVKKAISFHSAATMTPKAAQDLIRERARAAVQRRAGFKPFVMRGPLTLEISFKHYRQAEMLTYLPNVQRVNSHTVRFVGKDIVEVSRFIEFVTNYGTDLTP